MRTILTTSVLAAAMFTASSALAQGPETSKGLVLHNDGAYLHDGLYLRMALGGGGLVARDRVDGVARDQDSDLRGGGGAMEFSLGGSLRPGLVLAGSFLAQGAELGRIENQSGSTSVNKGAGLVLFGLTLDMYPDPRSGFHVSGSIGPALMSTVEDDRVNRRWRNEAGGGVSLATGYDWWISPQWSMGFLVRATGARLWGSTTYEEASDKVTSDPSSRRAVGTFSVLFSALFH
jgi:hypothetical protein